MNSQTIVYEFPKCRGATAREADGFGVEPAVNGKTIGGIGKGTATVEYQ